MKKKTVFIVLFAMIFAVCFGNAYARAQNSGAASGTAAIKELEVPGRMLLGLYAWDDDLLVYYMDDQKHMLCRMDSATGEIIARMPEGYDQSIALELCKDHRSETVPGAQENVPESSEAMPGLWENVPESSEAMPGLREAAPEPAEIMMNEDAGSRDGLLAEDIYIDDGIFGPETAENASPEDGHMPQSQDGSEPAGDRERGLLLRVYLAGEQKFQWLDKDFRVVDEYCLNEAISGQPLMDADSTFVYYVNSKNEVIRQDRRAGTKTVLDDGGPFYSPPYLERLYNGGTILSLSGNYMDSSETETPVNVRFCKNYIDVENNRLLASSERFESLTGSEDTFFASITGQLYQAVFGSYDRHQPLWEFIFDQYEEYEHLYAWPESDRLATFYTEYGIDGSSREVCALYSLETGHKAAEVKVDLNVSESESLVRPDYVCYIPESRTVAFHLGSRPDTIFLWNTGASQSLPEPEKCYKVPYLASDAQDAALLETLKAQAKAIEERYSVEIYMGGECPVQLAGYEAQTEVSVPKLRRALLFMEQTLADYPDGFFEQMNRSRGEVLKFYLVGRLIPDGSDSLSSTVGLYGGKFGQYIALAVDSPGTLQTLIYHEISHAVDYKISGHTDQNYVTALWQSLNPEGFSYAFGYRINQADTSWEYVFNGTGDNSEAYFIDLYSKSFPTEDRARIMENAMGRYPQTDYFSSPHIAAKLSYICTAIRENFDTRGWPETLWWERPLRK